MLNAALEIYQISVTLAQVILIVSINTHGLKNEENSKVYCRLFMCRFRNDVKTNNVDAGQGFVFSAS